MSCSKVKRRESRSSLSTPLWAWSPMLGLDLKSHKQSFQRVELWIRKSKIFVSFLRIASIKFFSSFKKEKNRDSFFNSFLFWWKTAQEFLALSRKTFLKIFEFRGISKLEKKTRNESSFFLLSFRKWIWNYRIFLFVNSIKNKERGFMNFWNDCWIETHNLAITLAVRDWFQLWI